MRAYESVVVLSPTLDEDAIAGYIDRFRAAIEQKGGEVRSVERWGKRRLAYDIQHFKEANYILLRFQAAEEGGITELEHVCRISEDVLRHLIVRAVEGGSARPDAKAEAPEEAAEAPSVTA